MNVLLWGLLGYVVIAGLVALEGRRQRRALQRAGERTTGSKMMAAGMLELQGMLQADRKVEVLQIELQDEDHVRIEDQRTDAGEDLP